MFSLLVVFVATIKHELLHLRFIIIIAIIIVPHLCFSFLFFIFSQLSLIAAVHDEPVATKQENNNNTHPHITHKKECCLRSLCVCVCVC